MLVHICVSYDDSEYPVDIDIYDDGGNMCYFNCAYTDLDCIEEAISLIEDGYYARDRGCGKFIKEYFT